MQIRKHYKQDTQEQRKFIVPTTGYEVGIFSFIEAVTKKINTETWQGAFNGDDSIDVTVFRCKPSIKDLDLLDAMTQAMDTYREEYKHKGFPQDTMVTYQPPYDKDTW